MSRRYKLVIIGTGTAVMVAAMRMRNAGWSVAVVDFRPFGGTCALRGCDPKKMLVGGAAAIDHARRMQGKGPSGELQLKWPDLIAFKRGLTDPVPRQREKSYAEQGIDAYHGQARFSGRNMIEVEGESLEAEHILIASGAEPVRLGISGEEHLATHETFLTLEKLPRRIVLVGGGYIASEFSHIAARAGAQVTVLQRGERMLKPFDPDLVGLLMEKFRRIGIDVQTRTVVETIEQTENGFRVHAASEGRKVSVDADLVVHAAGRSPPLDSLDLGRADVAVEDGRLVLNEYLQSRTNPAVYAAGDAAQTGPPLTPVASHDAKVVAANLLEGNRHKPDIPKVAGARCLAWEMVGYGASIPEGKERDISVGRQADYLVAWMEAISLEKAVLVGHDLGGGVAQIAAVRHRERLAGLVLMNAICYDSWPIPQVKVMRTAGPLVERLPNSIFRIIFSQFIRMGHDRG